MMHEKIPITDTLQVTGSLTYNAQTMQEHENAHSVKTCCLNKIFLIFEDGNNRENINSAQFSCLFSCHWCIGGAHPVRVPYGAKFRKFIFCWKIQQNCMLAFPWRVDASSYKESCGPDQRLSVTVRDEHDLRNVSHLKHHYFIFYLIISNIFSWLTDMCSVQTPHSVHYTNCLIHFQHLMRH